MPSSSKFQSTHPRGVRPNRQPQLTSSPGFNPRTRVGCDRNVQRADWDWVQFQSTHPRGVRRDSTVMELVHKAVSIHAPAWGATPLPGQRPPHIPVSIHAPAWGATCPQSGQSWQDCGFNPRTRVGCDVGGQGAHGVGGIVSIHAPAWGATKFRRNDISVTMVSIHAPAWGATGTPIAGRKDISEFQSTHPRGVRLKGCSRLPVR